MYQEYSDMSALQPYDDRRRFQRVQRLLGATLTLESEEPLKLFVVDLSLGGLHAAAHRRVASGLHGTIQLNADAGVAPLELPVEIVWSKETSLSGSYHFGLEFQSEADLTEVHTLVGSVEATPGSLGDTPSFRGLTEDELARFQTLSKISRILNRRKLLEGLLHQLTSLLQEAFEAERAMVMLKKEGAYEISSFNGSSPDGRSPDYSHQVIDNVEETGIPLICYEVSSDKKFAESQSLKLLGTRSILCVPLISNEQTFGFIYMDNSVLSGAFSAADLEMVTVLSETACVAIDRAEILSILRENEFELLEAKRQAEAANEAKTNFLANVSHELRTPINAVLGLTRQTLGTELTQQQTDYLQIVAKSAQELLELINDVLDYSRLSARELYLDLAPLSLEELVGETLERLAPVARDKGVAFQSELEDGLPEWVSGDNDRIRRVLTHLIGNAVKFNKAGGVATLRLRRGREDGLVLFQVEDTGIGMSEENLRKMFEPFTQVEESTTRNYGGLGMGLALSLGLIDQMGGTFHAESELGKGSLFEFSLPLTEVPPPDALPDFSPEEIPKLSILVVEDNPVNQMVAYSLLEEWGHRVSTADDGEKALELLNEDHTFDLVYMDLQMPVLDGLQATIALREREKTWNRTAVPVVALTAHGTGKDREACRQAGMNAFLNKPALENDFLKSLGALFLNRHPQKM